ncbi:unnamed protein product [Lepeophtheirus salmonis]|uniref:(salmon louse) hypothetical protein n=2 Tax=Lepeophtheirus salmonis TaxID=72036 RepID=A0A7R8HDF2_LEPSM|nr:uncharacterized protein LOC121124238 [Lepeophtheirus salmonis]CAB4069761.1 unnamed protein product [Lepeophtheirus salmonis]CAF3034018.1 unnamed protein product [Lepeophtheirus salmonis]
MIGSKTLAAGILLLALIQSSYGTSFVTNIFNLPNEVTSWKCFGQTLSENPKNGEVYTFDYDLCWTGLIIAKLLFLFLYPTFGGQFFASDDEEPVSSETPEIKRYGHLMGMDFNNPYEYAEDPSTFARRELSLGERLSTAFRSLKSDARNVVRYERKRYPEDYLFQGGNK